MVSKGQDDVGGLVHNELEIFGQRYLADAAIFTSSFEGGDLLDWNGGSFP